MKIIVIFGTIYAFIIIFMPYYVSLAKNIAVFYSDDIFDVLFSNKKLKKKLYILDNLCTLHYSISF